MSTTFLRRLLLSHDPHLLPRTDTSHLDTFTLDSGRSSVTFHHQDIDTDTDSETNTTTDARPSTTHSSTQQSQRSSPSIHATEPSLRPTKKFLVVNRLPPALDPSSSPSSSSSSSSSDPPLPNCALAPPLHWHRYQIETFRVIQGTAKFFFFSFSSSSSSSSSSVSGQPSCYQTRLAYAGDVVVIERDAWHTFRNASVTEDLVIEFVLDPPADDERFFRNTWMYRDDCARAEVLRSMMQVLLFNYYGGVVLAFPGLVWTSFGGGGGFTRLGMVLARWVGIALNFWGGRVLGQAVLGLRPSFEEYFDEGELHLVSGMGGVAGVAGDAGEGRAKVE